MGGVIIGYEIGKLLKKETIFCERVSGKFILRRGFNIRKGSKVLIIEDVITTGKSSMECVRLIKKAKASLVGFATIIDRSTKKSLKIKGKIVSLWNWGDPRTAFCQQCFFGHFLGEKNFMGTVLGTFASART